MIGYLEEKLFTRSHPSSMGMHTEAIISNQIFSIKKVTMLYGKNIVYRKYRRGNTLGI